MKRNNLVNGPSLLVDFGSFCRYLYENEVLRLVIAEKGLPESFSCARNSDARGGLAEEAKHAPFRLIG